MQHVFKRQTGIKNKGDFYIFIKLVRRCIEQSRFSGTRLTYGSGVASKGFSENPKKLLYILSMPYREIKRTIGNMSPQNVLLSELL